MGLSGYSGTPLAKKLGIKEGCRMSVVHPPEHYFQLFTDLPASLNMVNDPKKKNDLIHFFVKEEAELRKHIMTLRESISPNGSIWISWPKKASKVSTDITEDVIRGLALKNGLVDIKVCAVDEVWSGLKLVIPLKDRKA